MDTLHVGKRFFAAEYEDDWIIWNPEFLIDGHPKNAQIACALSKEDAIALVEMFDRLTETAEDAKLNALCEELSLENADLTAKLNALRAAVESVLVDFSWVLGSKPSAPERQLLERLREVYDAN